MGKYLNGKPTPPASIMVVFMDSKQRVLVESDCFELMWLLPAADPMEYSHSTTT